MLPAPRGLAGLAPGRATERVLPPPNPTAAQAAHHAARSALSGSSSIAKQKKGRSETISSLTTPLVVLSMAKARSFRSAKPWCVLRMARTT